MLSGIKFVSPDATEKALKEEQKAKKREKKRLKKVNSDKLTQPSLVFVVLADCIGKHICIQAAILVGHKAVVSCYQQSALQEKKETRQLREDAKPSEASGGHARSNAYTAGTCIAACHLQSGKSI